MFNWKAAGEVLVIAGMLIAFVTLVWGIGDAAQYPNNPAWHYFVSFGVALLLAFLGNGLSEGK